MPRRFLSILAATIIVSVLAVIPTSTEAYHAWGAYHWARTANPFTLKLGDNVDTKWDPYLREAASDWSTVPANLNYPDVLDAVVVSGSSNPRNCRATAGRVEVCNSRYGNNGWLGLAQIWISGSHITAGVAKMNDTYFNTTSYNTPAWRRLVMCQEVAHTFGLGHQDENFGPPNLGSCMDYTSDPDGGGAYGPSNEHPNAHDFEQLALIYGHLDSTSTISQGVTGSPFGVEAPNDPADFGRPTGPRDPFGRSIYFERDLGNGRRLLTHVFWVDPRMPGAEHAR